MDADSLTVRADITMRIRGTALETPIASRLVETTSPETGRRMASEKGWDGYVSPSTLNDAKTLKVHDQ
jgi:hypothetical protein